MPAADPIERQIRQVRRRRNLRELQRGLYFLTATAAGSAAALVLLALGADERSFAIATWTLVGAIAATGVWLARDVRRRWISSRRAAAWIDARADLGGRLTTLVALRARAAPRRDRGDAGSDRGDTGGDRDDAGGDRRSFLPLLAAENVARLDRWRPRRLVRRAIPLAALAAAAAAAAALLFAVWIAPRLRPPLPEIIYSDTPMNGTEADDDGRAGMPDRVVVAPAGAPESRRRGRGAATRGDGAGTDDADDDPAIARLPSELQDEIRRQFWGHEWQRAHDAIERAQRAAERLAARGGAAAGTRGAASDAGEAGGEPWETAGLPSERSGTRHAKAFGRAGRGRSTETSDAEAEARGFGKDEERTLTGTGSGAPAPGAGNATDPNLFGAPTDLPPRGGETFELAIDAPVRARPGGTRPASGEPPPAGADTHPELTRGARPEHAIRRMPVPPAYEAIVREVFAHRDANEETRP